MARYPKAKWDPITGGIGAYSSGPFKVVHHKTQGASLAGARSAYRANRSDPHFTVHALGVNQHIDTSVPARSLRNARGGVETNRESAIQIEAVGFSGESMDDPTLNNLVDLLVWIGHEHAVPWVWPEGRPPTSSQLGYGIDTGERHAAIWAGLGGHYGHSQVPENTHWDPAYTDREWWILNARCGPRPQEPGTPAPISFFEESDMEQMLVDMPPANGYGLSSRYVEFGHEVVPVSALRHGPSPEHDGWWPDQLGATIGAQPRGTGVVVTASGLKNSAVLNVWLTVR